MSSNPLDPINHPQLDDCFAQEVDELFQKVLEAIEGKQSLQLLINGYREAVYIKSADTQILAVNESYERVFSGNVSPVGRLSADYLDDSLKTVSASSDAMIVAGCTTVDYLHFGMDQQNRLLRLRTIKRSLMGSGHPRAAILGISQIVAVQEDSKLPLKRLDLSHRWQDFATLDGREQEVCVLIAKGESVKRMAGLLGVSDKTVENRRNAAMRKLNVASQAALIRLLVRFQDNGFRDFGLD